MFMKFISTRSVYEQLYNELYFHSDRIILKTTLHRKSRDASVGIVTDYGQNGRVQFPTSARDSIPQRPKRLWGPLSLLSNGNRRLFPRGKVTGA
jgi:hypothetical protein